MASLAVFDIEKVRRDPALQGQPWAIDWRAECSSTSTVLLQSGRAGARHGSVIVAERQTAGRGRRGTAWITPPGASLAFSLLWESGRAASASGLLPLAAGVACARALEGLGVQTVQLKWPNDLLLPSGKVGGILVESVQRGDRATMVIGIGINMREGQRLSADLARPVADLDQAGVALNREQVLTAILVHMYSALMGFEEGRDGDIVRAWSGFDALRGREVQVTDAASSVRGIARGIAPDGALCLDTAAGTRLIYAGEASIR